MISMIQKRLRNKKGFTLVELMVVVGIIAVLVAIAVPAYNSVTAKAEKTACDANIRVIEGAKAVAIANKEWNTSEEDPKTELKTLLANKDYFPEEPKCPQTNTNTYSIASGTGRVICSNDHK